MFMNITTHEHEGYTFLEFEGTFWKGCRRCGGTGHYLFDGFDSKCYLCRDSSAKLGDELGTLEQAQAWCHGKRVAQDRRDAKREQERLAKLAKRTAAWDALEASHPAVWALLTSVVNVRAWDQPEGDVYPSANERDSFLLAMTDQLWKLDERPFTARQLEVLADKAVKRTAQQAEAAAHPAPSGRVAVTGEIISTKVVEGDYGTAYKILVKDDAGYKVWASLPKAQADEAFDSFREEYLAAGYDDYTFGPTVWFEGTAQGQESQWKGLKGRRITFTATLEPSKDDVAFAFGSRPSKGSWI
ncbi:hypothetical protein NEBULOUS_29 [Microbacterium phage Nebulous]|nr:hypothetical protein NEBULOUS_29 [Microbacterium phage Nebulous]